MTSNKFLEADMDHLAFKLYIVALNFFFFLSDTIHWKSDETYRDFSKGKKTHIHAYTQNVYTVCLWTSLNLA